MRDPARVLGWKCGIPTALVIGRPRRAEEQQTCLVPVTVNIDPYSQLESKQIVSLLVLFAEETRA